MPFTFNFSFTNNIDLLFSFSFTKNSDLVLVLLKNIDLLLV